MQTTFTSIAELHEHIEEGRECPDFARDRDGDTWVLDRTEDGDWQGVRPRRDDEDLGPDEDEWRPIGPTAVEHMAFPLTLLSVNWSTQ